MLSRCLIILILLFELSLAVNGYAKLGSEPPEECKIFKYECPSHYVCVSKKQSDFNGVCVCDRFFGFRGEHCLDLTSASYLVIVLFSIIFVLGILLLIYNISLIHLLYKRNKLKANIWVTLLCNALSTLIIDIAGLCTALTVDVDKQMFYQEHMRQVFIACELFIFHIGSLAISLYWLQISEKVNGRKIDRLKTLKYKVFLYGTGLLWGGIALPYYLYFRSLGPVTFLGPMIVILAYYQGAKLVTGQLRNMENIEGISILACANALELANGIDKTSKFIIKWTFAFVFSTAIHWFTVMNTKPIYPNQNSLPRWCQGQFALFMVFICIYTINFKIIQYFHFIAFRDSLEYVPLKNYHFIDVLKHFTVDKKRDHEYTIETSAVQDDMRTIEEVLNSSAYQTSGQLTLDILKSETMMQSSILDPAAVFLIGPQQAGPDGKRMVRVPVPSNGFGTQSHVMMPTMMPLALVTLNERDIEEGITKLNSRIVIDYGDGTLVEYEDDDLEGDDSTSKLSVGCHAFVRCYGESFLRCTLASFEFGSAGGHPLLANFSQVLMAGEIEVDEHGNLTRWLNKSGLYMPPRFLIGQSGLPFELAWIYMSEEDVMAFDEMKRQLLVQSGCLVHLVLPGSIATGGNQVPSPISVHGMDTWIMKVGEDTVWQPSISTSSYNVAKEAVARFKMMKRNVRKQLMKQRERRQVVPSLNTEVMKLAISKASDSKMFTESGLYGGGGKVILNDHLSKNKGTGSLELAGSNNLSYEMRIGNPVLRGTVNSYKSSNSIETNNDIIRTIEEGETDEEEKEGGSDEYDDEEMEQREILEKVKAMKREMKAAGVFDVHRRGAEERRDRKAELGFSTSLKL